MNDRSGKSLFADNYVSNRFNPSDEVGTGNFTPYTLDAIRREEFSKAASAAIARQRKSQPDSRHLNHQMSNLHNLQSLLPHQQQSLKSSLLSSLRIVSSTLDNSSQLNNFFRQQQQQQHFINNGSVSGSGGGRVPFVLRTRKLPLDILSNKNDHHKNNKTSYRESNEYTLSPQVPTRRDFHQHHRRNNYNLLPVLPLSQQYRHNRQHYQSQHQHSERLNCGSDRLSSISQLSNNLFSSYNQGGPRKRSYRDLDAPDPVQAKLDSRRLVSYADIVCSNDDESNNQHHQRPRWNRRRRVSPTNSCNDFHQSKNIPTSNPPVLPDSAVDNANNSQETANIPTSIQPQLDQVNLQQSTDQVDSDDILKTTNNDADQPVDDDEQEEGEIVDNTPIAIPLSDNRRQLGVEESIEEDDDFEQNLKAELHRVKENENKKNKMASIATAAARNMVTCGQQDLLQPLNADQILKHLIRSENSLSNTDFIEYDCAGDDDRVADVCDVVTENDEFDLIEQPLSVHSSLNSSDLQYRTPLILHNTPDISSYQKSATVVAAAAAARSAMINVPSRGDLVDPYITSKTLAEEHRLVIQNSPFGEYECNRDFKRRLLREYRQYTGCSRMPKPLTNFQMFKVLKEQFELHVNDANRIAKQNKENVIADNIRCQMISNNQDNGCDNQFIDKRGPTSSSDCTNTFMPQSNAEILGYMKSILSGQMLPPPLNAHFGNFSAPQDMLGFQKLFNANLEQQNLLNNASGYLNNNAVRFANNQMFNTPQSTNNTLVTSNGGGMPFDFRPCIPPPNYRPQHGPTSTTNFLAQSFPSPAQFRPNGGITPIESLSTQQSSVMNNQSMYPSPMLSRVSSSTALNLQSTLPRSTDQLTSTLMQQLGSTAILGSSLQLAAVSSISPSSLNHQSICSVAASLNEPIDSVVNSSSATSNPFQSPAASAAAIANRYHQQSAISLGNQNQQLLNQYQQHQQFNLPLAQPNRQNSMSEVVREAQAFVRSRLANNNIGPAANIPYSSRLIQQRLDYKYPSNAPPFSLFPILPPTTNWSAAADVASSNATIGSCLSGNAASTGIFNSTTTNVSSNMSSIAPASANLLHLHHQQRIQQQQRDEYLNALMKFKQEARSVVRSLGSDNHLSSSLPLSSSPLSSYRHYQQQQQRKLNYFSSHRHERKK
ncbi:hypothetical protein GJ496_005183 [Pomphorhynchus laevis]|nr:hypothetical protein GJ496_005183 [Pomphorhynchus laevis]